MINYNSESFKVPSIIDYKISRWISAVALKHDFQVGELNYLFCSDEYILEINNQYLNHDYFTDIITFDYTLNNVISGDIIISLDTVRSNSIKFNKTFDDELLRVVIHGVLHLCRYKDKSPEEALKMRELEDDALLMYSTFK